jgi:integrase
VPARKTSDGRTPDGKWIDRWFEGVCKRQRTFDRKTDRDAFRARRRRAEQLGHDLATELLLEDDLTLSAWCEEWWARHAVPNLEPQTRTSYKQQWGKWIQPRLGNYELRALTPRVINTQLAQAMRKAGAGEPTIRRCLAITQSMLRLAVIEERIASNPVDLLDKPSAVPERQIDPTAPAVVERMRRAAVARRGPLGAADAFIVAMLAYAGLRPQELLALEWDDVLSDVGKLLIARKNVDGQVLPYLKSGRRHRNRRRRRIDLFEPLAADLRAQRMRTGARRGLVIATGRRAVAQARLGQLAQARLAAARRRGGPRRARRPGPRTAGALLGRGPVRAARPVRVAAGLGGPHDARGGGPGRARRRRVRDVLRAELRGLRPGAPHDRRGGDPGRAPD